MRMILLILVWHFIVIGFFAIVIGFMASLVSSLVFGTGALVIGLVMSIALKKTSNLRSDPLDKAAEDRPLDFY